LTGSLAADGQTTASGNLNMGTNRIVNLADPQNAQDAATKYYVDQLIAALGTMAYQNANAVAITGGTVNNVSINLSTKTDETYLPVGPTILRTVSPIDGLIRYNTDGEFYEGYQNGIWVRFVTAPQGEYTITYVIVAGGGSGGNLTGGGGGAGGMLASTFTGIPAVTYTIVVGGGGAGGTSGSNGSNSYITGIATCTGGGTGGSQGSAAGNGGSGGGTNSVYGYSAGTGIPGQGNNGAGSTAAVGSFDSGGGGGGASAGGSIGSYGNGGAGGAGLVTTITGTTITLAGGGGGAGGTTSGAGGAGGGGGGGSTGSNGTAFTGGGGGGTYGGPSTPGGNGGSGVVYLSMPTVNYSGTTTGIPTVTTSGLNTILKFTNSGTYVA
jgi:hypothetical protein